MCLAVWHLCWTVAIKSQKCTWASTGRSWINLRWPCGGTHSLPQTSTSSLRSQWARLMATSRSLDLICNTLATGPFACFIEMFMNNCRAMPQITSTTSHTLWSPCLRYCGGLTTPRKTPDTRFCFPLPPLWCHDLPTAKTVRPVFCKTLKKFRLVKEGLKTCHCISSDTVPEERVFSVHVGTFLHDVELRNITFSTGVLTIEESRARGFTVQEHSFPNGTKSFSLQVPIDADVVLKHVCVLTVFCKI